MSKQYILTDEQVKSIVELINNETAANIANQDEAYNTHWDNILLALGASHAK